MAQFKRTLMSCLSEPDNTAIKDMITVKVLSTSNVTQYKKKDSQTNSMFTSIACDETAAAKALCYSIDHKPNLLQDTYVHILDYIVRNSQIIITSKTQIFRTNQALEIPEDIRNKATELMSIASTAMTVLDAATSPKKTMATVKGVVYSIGQLETKTVRATGEEIFFRKLKLADTTSKIRVALWRDLAKQPMENNTHVKLNNFTVSDTFDTYNKSVPSLTNKVSTASIEILPPTDEILDDSISDDDDENNNQPIGELLSISNVNVYRCCLNTACYNRKLLNMRCPACGIIYKENSQGKGYIAKLLLKTDNSITSYTIFTQQVKTLLSQLDLSHDIEDCLIGPAIISKLPVNIKYTTTVGQKISELTVIKNAD